MKLEKVALDESDSPVLYVEGADLMNGTPIFDIKPIFHMRIAIRKQQGSFTEYSKDHHLNVEFPQGASGKNTQGKQRGSDRSACR